MSQQMADPFVWDNKEYVFIGADDVYTLFDTSTFGLKPTAPHTACWKGFVIHFLLKNNQLYISKLEVYCEDNNYPSINNIDAYKEENESFYMYDSLNLPLTYTGNIVIGTKLLDRYVGRAFTGAHSYENTYDLHFVDGILESYLDSTGKYSGF